MLKLVDYALAGGPVCLVPLDAALDELVQNGLRVRLDLAEKLPGRREFGDEVRERGELGFEIRDLLRQLLDPGLRDLFEAVLRPLHLALECRELIDVTLSLADALIQSLDALLLDAAGNMRPRRPQWPGVPGALRLFA